ncbi:MAG: DUF2341 domain-containing protein [Candidatus Kerfeldbacteria bacterium]|nr:DUF2341 domain-containing protein [Candidatus Kerfeldbacteria bacterium]
MARLEMRMTQEHSFFLRVFLSLGFIPLACLSILYATFLLVFFSPQNSFSTLSSLDPDKGYLQSYTYHRLWQRKIQISVVAISILMVLISVLSGILIPKGSVHANTYSVTCSGTSDSPTSVTESTYTSSDDVTFTGSGYCTLDAAFTAQSVTVQNGVTLTHPASNTTGVSFTVTTLTVDTGGSINVDGKGCQGATTSGAYGPQSSSPYTCSMSGGGYGNSAYGTAGSGAGYGGRGGNGSTGSLGGNRYNTNGNAGGTLGAGGGRDANESGAIGGYGGGKIYIQATNITINGILSADGADGAVGTTSAGGGGAGGAVFMTTTAMGGTGTITAIGGNGGDGSSQDGGGGGGGRVLVQYATFASGETISSQTTVTGGQSSTTGLGGSDGSASYTVQIPNTPTISSPENGATNVSENPTFTSSSYSANSGTHTSSDWKVTSDSSGNTTVWSATGSTTNKTSIIVNSTNGTFSGTLNGQTTLAANTQYYAFVRYTNSSGNSDWSSAVNFVTSYTGNTTTQTWQFNNATPTGAFSYQNSYIEINASSNSLARLKDQGSNTYVQSTGITNWTTRKQITISGLSTPSGVLTSNYPARITVTHATGMNADFSDVRFTSSDGITELSYWLESKTNSSNAVFYVKIPTYSSGSATIYMYYGNSSATTTSDISSLFIFADELDSALSSSWTEITAGNASTGTFSGGSWIKSCNGECTMSTTSALDAGITTNIPTSSVASQWEAITKLSAVTGTGSSRQVGIMLNEGLTDAYNLGYYPDTQYGLYTTNTATSTCTVAGTSLPVYLKITKNATANSYSFSTSTNGTSWTTCTTLTDSTISTYGLFVRDSTTGETAGTFDYFIVKKPATTEPSASFGSAQSLASLDNVQIIPASTGDHPQFNTLYTLSETLGGSNQGTVYYQIGLDSDRDGTITNDVDATEDGWYVVSENTWTLADNDSQDKNTISTINSYLPNFASEIGNGDFYFKTFLFGTGSQPTEIDSVTLTYTVAPTFSGSISTTTTNEDTNATDIIALPSYFSDPEDTLSYSIVDDLDPALGSLSIDGSGNVHVTVITNANGSDTLQFRASDEEGLNTDTNAFTFSITAVNDAPTANAGTDINANETDGTVILDGSGSSDIDEDALQYTWVELIDDDNACSLNDVNAIQPTVNMSNNSSNYSCAFRLTADDGTTTATDTVNVNVTAVNDPPTFTGSITNQSMYTNTSIQDAVQLEQYFSAGDSDDTCTYSASNDLDTNIGTMNIQDDGAVDIDITTQTSATDTLQFRCTDTGNETIDSNTITLTITSTNAAPVFSDALPEISFFAGTTTRTVFNLSNYFSDPEGEPLTYSVSGNTAVEVMITDGQVIFSAESDFTGTEWLTFFASDGQGNTTTSNIIVVTVSAAITPSIINYASGTATGEGIITLVGNDESTLYSWVAFPKGGVIPRIEIFNNDIFVFSVKRQTGTTMHLYNQYGNILKKMKVSPRVHWRKLAIGSLDKNTDSIEVVTGTKRGKNIYFKIFSYYPEQNTFVLRRQARYHSFAKKRYQIDIQDKRIQLRNTHGQILFMWRPY